MKNKRKRDKKRQGGTGGEKKRGTYLDLGPFQARGAYQELPMKNKI